MVISMFIGIKSDYVQVVVLQPRYHEKMAEMGWVKDPELLPDSREPVPVEAPELPVTDPVVEAPKNSVESATKPKKDKVQNDSGRSN